MVNCGAFRQQGETTDGGFATDTQEALATERLRAMLFEDAPTMAQVPVYNERGATGARRPRLLRQKFDARIVDLSGPANGQFVGEVLYDVTRKPTEGVGVVALHAGQLGAWTYHKGPVWLESGTGERISSGFEIQGVIVRVTQELEMV